MSANAPGQPPDKELVALSQGGDRDAFGSLCERYYGMVSILAYQKILVLGQSPSPLHWAALAGAGVGLFWAGSRFFAWAKRVAMDYV